MMENMNKGYSHPVKNFFAQTKKAEQFMKFRHQCEMELAEMFGARFKNFTPDSCDMIFPNKESMDAFEEARKDYAMQLTEKEKMNGFC